VDITMIGKITEYMMMKLVERKLGKYNITLMHFIPGRIRLQSSEWKTNHALVTRIVELLQVQSFVFSVQSTKETGSLVITYDALYVTNIQELETWFGVLDEVYTTKYVK
jgi:hypothetical protein